MAPGPTISGIALLIDQHGFDPVVFQRDGVGHGAFVVKVVCRREGDDYVLGIGGSVDSVFADSDDSAPRTGAIGTTGANQLHGVSLPGIQRGHVRGDRPYRNIRRIRRDRGGEGYLTAV